MTDGKNKLTTAIILAGGNGSRLGSDIPKQLVNLCGKSILRRTVESFYNCELVDKIVIVTRPSDMEIVKKELHFAIDKIASFVIGGESRAASARQGFLSIPEGTEYIAIHDGARCMIRPEDINSVLTEAYKNGAASAARRINDTVKCIKSDIVIDTIPRESLVLAETPQVFSVELYKKALENTGEDVTDDNRLLEKSGVPISVVYLDHPNIKITTKYDLEYAEFLLSREKHNEQNDYRIGQGYDVHRLVEGRKLILGGVDIPFSKGLLGHSDADVLIHAIMDAILGAVGQGDIGKHFPDTSDEYRGISSLELLRKVADIVDKSGAEIVNIDSTIVLQSPKISPYIEKMQKNISGALKVSEKCVNIKATTEEHLGFTGRGEGAKAEAIALLRKK